mmetsp:Transcript_36196/g.108311  ORF Transcript_36196/g.108311 Transcript_36196/m.108311 type:complete len:322 (-) Transcript_36196:1266-2231(-)
MAARRPPWARRVRGRDVAGGSQTYSRPLRVPPFCSWREGRRPLCEERLHMLCARRLGGSQDRQPHASHPLCRPRCECEQLLRWRARAPVRHCRCVRWCPRGAAARCHRGARDLGACARPDPREDGWYLCGRVRQRDVCCTSGQSGGGVRLAAPLHCRPSGLGKDEVADRRGLQQEARGRSIERQKLAPKGCRGGRGRGDSETRDTGRRGCKAKSPDPHQKARGGEGQNPRAASCRAADRASPEGSAEGLESGRGSLQKGVGPAGRDGLTARGADRPAPHARAGLAGAASAGESCESCRGGPGAGAREGDTIGRGRSHQYRA